MTDLLRRHAEGACIPPPSGSLIDGDISTAGGGGSHYNVNPATGRVQAAFPAVRPRRARFWKGSPLPASSKRAMDVLLRRLDGPQRRLVVDTTTEQPFVYTMPESFGVVAVIITRNAPLLSLAMKLARPNPGATPWRSSRPYSPHYTSLRFLELARGGRTACST